MVIAVFRGKVTNVAAGCTSLVDKNQEKSKANKITKVNRKMPCLGKSEGGKIFFSYTFISFYR